MTAIKKFFNERIPNSKMNDDDIFDKAWEDGLEGADDPKAVKVGTLRFMAKRDNPESYNLIFPPKVSVVEEPIRMQNTFSRDDNFYWADFVALMKAKVFESKAELRREFKKNMPRVLALVSEGEGLVVKKDSEACLFSHLSLAKLEGLSNFTMKYWSDSVPDDAPEAACRF
jgi:hypothetical protein